MELDERGIPITVKGETSSAHHPPNPCELCTGHASTRNADGSWQTSWEWCKDNDTCSATVDWELVFQGR